MTNNFFGFRKKKNHHSNSHNSGIISIDYYAYTSKMNKWNPTFKVILAIFLLVASIAANSNIVTITIFISMMLLTVNVGKMNLKNYLRLFLVVFTFAILSGLAIILDFSKNPVGDYNLKLFSLYIVIRIRNILNAINIILKALAAISAMYMLVLSTPSYEIIEVLHKAKVPKIIIELMNIIYRYIFILMSVQRAMNISAKSRLGYSDFKSGYRSFVGIGINLFVISFKKASFYYDAMESRCYDGELCFLSEEKPVNRKHVTLAIIYGLFIISLFIIKR